MYAAFSLRTSMPYVNVDRVIPAVAEGQSQLAVTRLVFVPDPLS